MNGNILKILREYNALVDGINDANIKVRINSEPFRTATKADKLELLREEWFKTVEKLAGIGIELP